MLYVLGTAMRVLGIDFGTKKVGIALSDPEGRFALPHSVVPNDRKLVEHLVALITREGVGTIILGESKDFMMRPNPLMRKINRFKSELEKRLGLPVLFESEVFTSAEARRGGVTKELIDASAAALILEKHLARTRKP